VFVILSGAKDLQSGDDLGSRDPSLRSGWRWRECRRPARRDVAPPIRSPLRQTDFRQYSLRNFSRTWRSTVCAVRARYAVRRGAEIALSRAKAASV